MSHSYNNATPNPQGPHNPGEPQYIYVQQEQPKKKNGCVKWTFFAVAAVVIIAALGEDSTDTEDATTTISGESVASESPANQGEGEAAVAASAPSNDDGRLENQEDVESNLALGETYEARKGLAVTVDSAAIVSTSYGTSKTCVNVTYANNGSDQPGYSEYWDWKLQTPSGIIIDPTGNIRDDALDSGELAPGGARSGSVCFDAVESGPHIVNYTPTLTLSSDDAKWDFTL